MIGDGGGASSACGGGKPGDRLWRCLFGTSEAGGWDAAELTEAATALGVFALSAVVEDLRLGRWPS